MHSDPREDAQQESYELWVAPKNAYKTWLALISGGAIPVGVMLWRFGASSMASLFMGSIFASAICRRRLNRCTRLTSIRDVMLGRRSSSAFRSRGNVHRKFTGFLIEGLADVVAGAKIISGEKEVGEITSVAVMRTASGEQTVALGYIRREIGLPGREVTVGTAKAIVTQLPFDTVAPGGIRRESLLQPR